jgi:hypothetical protein
VQPQSWSVGIDLNWASTALVQRVGAETLIVDAETREARMTLTRSWSDRFVMQLQIPYRYTGGGVLDDAIDGWHDAFGLPEGARTQLPTDRIRIAYERNGAVLLDRDTSASGFADLSIDLGYALFTAPASAVTAWLSVELPTGDADRFTGNDSTDASVAIAGQHRLAERWSLFGQAAVTRLGDGDLLTAQQRDIVWSALAGVGRRMWRGLELKAQLDAHSEAFAASNLDFLSSPLVLTVGADYRFDSGWRLDVAVSEDIAVETASDVVFVFGWRKDF